MTARSRVRRAQRQLVGAFALAALLWSAALGMIVILLAAVADTMFGLGQSARAAIIPVSGLAALAGLLAVIWRGRAAWSAERTALWVEEQEPRLRYALVTAIDLSIAPADRHAALHDIAQRADVAGIAGRAGRRVMGRAAVACGLAVAALLMMRPRDLLRAAGSAMAEQVVPRAPAPMANRLRVLMARVIPPAYSRLSEATVREPSHIASLIGSRITLTGQGAQGGLTAAMGAGALPANADGHGWAVGMTMPTEPVVVELRDRTFRRLVALDPVTDSAPKVKLLLPARDTTYQTVPSGTLTIEAELSDDIGLAHGYVEYLLSTGSEESFETKQVLGPSIPYDNARQGTLHATIGLDTMRLQPGSILHIRVVAFDYNDVTGPGKGVSETRTLRIAEPVDSTSISAAPPLPIDSMWISQRLLNMRTDTLIRDRRTLEHERFVHTSTVYSNGQDDIRQRALTVIATLEDNGVGGAFQTDASRMLRTVVDLMWTAREALGVAHPDTALPYMKKILAILDELRLAHRYYLRGILKPVAVNVERVRLTGKDSTLAGPRRARASLIDVHAALAARIDAAAALARVAPQAAADSLTFIRVAALTGAPDVASALESAIDRLRAGAPADSALARTRRALEPRARIGGGVTWAGMVP